MKRKYLVTAISLAILAPSVAAAQETCEQRSENRAAGTAIGAMAGALLGSAVAGHHKKGEGAVIGGVAGAIAGNQLARGPRDCAHAYGWYDDGGRWHSNRVDTRVATGYYDQSGAWVDGPPPGYGPPPAYPPPAYASPPPRRGDWDRGEFTGYPQFRDFEARIRAQIDDGVREDLIEPDEAHDLMRQLQDIRMQESREFQVHGWRLPYDDEMQIRERLRRLDHEVDEIRNEP